MLRAKLTRFDDGDALGNLTDGKLKANLPLFLFRAVRISFPLLGRPPFLSPFPFFVIPCGEGQVLGWFDVLFRFIDGWIDEWVGLGEGERRRKRGDVYKLNYSLLRC